VDGLAYNLYGTDKMVCPIMDARRDQVYTGLYEFIDDRLIVISPQKAVSIDELVEEINQIGRETIFLGDGVPIHRERIENKMKNDYEFAPIHMNRQRAGAIAALGLQYYRLGQVESADQHQPVYLRMSQAERERAEKLNKYNTNEE
jgi:tRNA threonylcarbamoyladenosine biosynthesis protein TsaB